MLDRRNRIFNISLIVFIGSSAAMLLHFLRQVMDIKLKFNIYFIHIFKVHRDKLLNLFFCRSNTFPQLEKRRRNREVIQAEQLYQLENMNELENKKIQ